MKHKIIIHVVEMATHFTDDDSDYVKIPIEICDNEDSARVALSTAVAAYCEKFDNPEIDNHIEDDIIVYEEPGKKYPYAEFWTYKAEVILE